MVPHPPTQPGEVSAAPALEAVVLSRLPCVACGYDLKTMRVSARCPECGAGCEASLGSMYAADGADVAAMVAGLRKMVWAAVVFPLIGGGLLYLDIRRSTMGPELTLLGLAGVGIAGPLLARAGLRRVAEAVRPSPGAAAVRPMPILLGAEGVRIAAKAYAVFSTMLAVLLIALMAWDRSGPGPADGWLWATGALAVGTGVSWTVRNGLFCVRGAEIAGLSNRPGMRRVFRLMAWVSGGGTVAVLGYGLAGVVMYVYKNELLYGFTSGRRSHWMEMTILGVQIVASAVNMAAIVWLMLWPVMLALLARHLRSVDREISAAGGVVIGAVRVEE